MFSCPVHSTSITSINVFAMLQNIKVNYLNFNAISVCIDSGMIHWVQMHADTWGGGQFPIMRQYAGTVH